jgi:hypothetical protein
MESQTDKQQNNQEDKEYYFLGIKQGFTDSQSPPQTKEFGRKHTIDVPFSVLKGKQRRFDRHSGTGRGKEIKKQGAGGKTVWGSDRFIVSHEISGEEPNEEDYEIRKGMRKLRISDDHAITYKEYKERRAKKSDGDNVETKVETNAFSRKKSISEMENTLNKIISNKITQVEDEGKKSGKEEKRKEVREGFVYKAENFPSLS